jgi:hypothetical protein
MDAPVATPASANREPAVVEDMDALKERLRGDQSWKRQLGGSVNGNAAGSLAWFGGKQ